MCSTNPELYKLQGTQPQEYESTNDTYGNYIDHKLSHKQYNVVEDCDLLIQPKFVCKTSDPVKQISLRTTNHLTNTT